MIGRFNLTVKSVQPERAAHTDSGRSIQIVKPLPSADTGCHIYPQPCYWFAVRSRTHRTLIHCHHPFFWMSNTCIAQCFELIRKILDGRVVSPPSKPRLLRAALHVALAAQTFKLELLTHFEIINVHACCVLPSSNAGRR